MKKSGKEFDNLRKIKNLKKDFLIILTNNKNLNNNEYF